MPFKACGEVAQAHALAEAIISEYELDPNCGAKPLHFEIAKEYLESTQRLTY